MAPKSFRLGGPAFPAHALLRVPSEFRCTLVEVVLTILQPQLPDAGPVVPVGRAHLPRGRIREDRDQHLVALFRRMREALFAGDDVVTLAALGRSLLHT